MRINTEEVSNRRVVWEAAQELVQPIIETHGLEDYWVNQGPFVKGSTFTKVDQHIDQILRVANWLIKEEE